MIPRILWEVDSVSLCHQGFRLSWRDENNTHNCGAKNLGAPFLSESLLLSSVAQMPAVWLKEKGLPFSSVAAHLKSCRASSWGLRWEVLRSGR